MLKQPSYKFPEELCTQVLVLFLRQSGHTKLLLNSTYFTQLMLAVLVILRETPLIHTQVSPGSSLDH